MTQATSDPGIGDPKAELGTSDWAKHWRLIVQSAVKGAVFDVNHVATMIQIGNEHRAWTVLNKKDGTTFKDFDEFVSYEYPWGLSRKPDEFRKMLEVAMGKEAAQLETVSEPRSGNQYTESAALPVVAQQNRKTEYALRAINRAPAIVGDRWRSSFDPRDEDQSYF